MEDRTTQSSLAEKMNQLYKEREEQYQRREKLFDERGAQLQSLSDSLEKKKNALDERANVLNGREAELNQVQDALTAKLNELEKKEADLKAWEQKTRADLEAEKQAQTNDLLEKKVAQENELMKRQQELQIEKLQAQNLSSELTVPALIECSVRLWKPMKSRKWIKIVVLSSHFPVNQSSTKSINPFMIHPILNQKNTALIGTQLKLSEIRMENYLQSITLKNFIFLIRICRKKFKRISRRVILTACCSD